MFYLNILLTQGICFYQGRSRDPFVSKAELLYYTAAGQCLGLCPTVTSSHNLFVNDCALVDSFNSAVALNKFTGVVMRFA
jgi:hypothetical protein